MYLLHDVYLCVTVSYIGAVTVLIMIPQTNGCSLPSDLKEFYLTNNGLTLTWKYLYNGEFGHACVQCCCIVDIHFG